MVKTHKVLRDNIQGINRYSLRRIAIEAGNPRVSGLVYEEVRSIIVAWLEEIFKLLVAVIEQRRAKTIKIRDIELFNWKYIDKQPENKLQKLPVERLLREVIQDYKTDVNFSSDVIDFLKIALESYLFTLFEKASEYRKLEKRETLFPGDVRKASNDLLECFF